MSVTNKYVQDIRTKLNENAKNLGNKMHPGFGDVLASNINRNLLYAGVLSTALALNGCAGSGGGADYNSTGSTTTQENTSTAKADLRVLGYLLEAKDSPPAVAGTDLGNGKLYVYGFKNYLGHRFAVYLYNDSDAKIMPGEDKFVRFMVEEDSGNNNRFIAPVQVFGAINDYEIVPVDFSQYKRYTDLGGEVKLTIDANNQLKNENKENNKITWPGLFEHPDIIPLDFQWKDGAMHYSVQNISAKAFSPQAFSEGMTVRLYQAKPDYAKQEFILTLLAADYIGRPIASGEIAEGTFFTMFNYPTGNNPFLFLRVNEGRGIKEHDYSNNDLMYRVNWFNKGDRAPDSGNDLPEMAELLKK